MESLEKKIRLETLEIALNDINKIIDTMQEKCYPQEEINEYNKKRWELWNEIHRTKKS